MARNRLTRYMREHIDGGYDTNSIRAYLLKYGYTQQQIDLAMRNIYPLEVKPTIHFSKLTTALIVAIFCMILISSGIFIYINFRGPSQLLDVRTNMVARSIESGDPISFTIEMFNLGKSNRYDVLLRYEVYDLGNNLITFKEETIALETKASSPGVIDWGEQFPGNYYLRTTASYKKGTAKASSSFKVIRPSRTTIETIPDVSEPDEPVSGQPIISQCPLNCDDNNACTTDYCDEKTNYVCKHDIIIPCCGNYICDDDEDPGNCEVDCFEVGDDNDGIFSGRTIWETLDFIGETAKSDKGLAVSYCNEIKKIILKYNCFADVAVNSNDGFVCNNIDNQLSKDNCYKDFSIDTADSSMCAEIFDEFKKDACYMKFVGNGDYTVCDNLVDGQLRSSCENLKELSEM